MSRRSRSCGVLRLALAAALLVSAPVLAQQKPAPSAPAPASAPVAAPAPAKLPEGEALLAFAQADPAGAAQTLAAAISNARARDPGFPTLTHLAWLDAHALALVQGGQLVEAAAIYEELGQLWGGREEITPDELADLRLQLRAARTRFAEVLSDQA